ncbi:hypothetical protein GCM10023085_42050 [Actinomadura viridis]|uniref:Uncharacterized protein n=1 Tax=Actinomadura viridis TaxID=58110 RepID=A0A931DSA3_9ACTN|nr:hypothetical protein [Actinomadura viridis]MBG6092520.1 hypothetical protein [Actinomadura viridis]
MTITSEETVPPVPITPRELISPSLFERLVGRVVKDERLSPQYAARVMEQTLAFLATCARHPNAGLSPSKAVDLGWHAFVLCTAEYAEFCQRAAGRFIHHVPIDDDGDHDEAVVTRTVTAMRAAGLPVDEELWQPDAADCNQCYAGCHDSP